MNRGSHHFRTGALRPRRTAFDLSYEKKFNCDFGVLIPIMCDECVPGDHWSIGNQIVIRTQPLFSPILHEVYVSTHYFFVPYRLLWQNWEKFITGGPKGDYVTPIPAWPFQDAGSGHTYGSTKFTLWDYFGFPLGPPLTTSSNGEHWQPDYVFPASVTNVNAFPLGAYNLVWEEYFRDENFQLKVGYTDLDENTADGNPLPADRLLKNYINPSYTYSHNRDTSVISPELEGYPAYRNFKKDYFTSALPFQQRGPAIAFPITGILPVQYDYATPWGNALFGNIGTLNSSTLAFTPSTINATNNPGFLSITNPGGPISNGLAVSPANVDLNDSISFDVADLRRITQLQKWMERNARAGVRYTEFLRAHFGVTPSDERLQRPEYIGGTKSYIITSEVLQTSSTQGTASTGEQTPQGNMAGHGIMAAGGFVGRYFVQEYGLILGLMSIMPKPSYEDGINRQWLRRINTDYYFPEFVNLSEQAIYNAEIYAQGFRDSDFAPWGFQPQYDEMRIKNDMVCGDFRVNSYENLSHWHLGRAFSSLPFLNFGFNQADPLANSWERVFPIQSRMPFFVAVGNSIKAVRPLPYIGEPGLVDHH